MSKKRAVITLCLVSVITALALIFSFISFDVAGKNYRYVGFAQAIYKGIEYDGGVYADYTATRPEDMSDEDFNAKLEDTFKRVESILSTKNINNAFISKTSDGGIRIEAPAKDDTSDVLSTIGAGVLKIRTSSDSTATPIITGENVTAAFATQLQTSSYAYQWGAYIAFDDTAKAVLADKTSNAANSAVTLYMFRGDSESAFFSISISEKIEDGFMFISSSSMSQNYAEELAIQMYCGSTPLTLNTVGNQVNTIGPSMGRSALLLTSIALLALIVAVIIFYVVRYREFGLMLSLSTLLYVGLMLFLLQTITLFEISIAGVAGVLLSFLLFAASNIIPMEKVKEEYAKGKKIPAAVKAGYKKSYGLVVDFTVVAFVTSLLCYFIGTAALKTFAIALLVGCLLSVVVSLVISKSLIDCHVVYNKTNEKRVNLKREEGIDEIG